MYVGASVCSQFRYRIFLVFQKVIGYSSWYYVDVYHQCHQDIGRGRVWWIYILHLHESTANRNRQQIECARSQPVRRPYSGDTKRLKPQHERDHPPAHQRDLQTPNRPHRSTNSPESSYLSLPMVSLFTIIGTRGGVRTHADIRSLDVTGSWSGVPIILFRSLLTKTEGTRLKRIPRVRHVQYTR